MRPSGLNATPNTEAWLVDVDTGELGRLGSATFRSTVRSLPVAMVRRSGLNATAVTRVSSVSVRMRVGADPDAWEGHRNAFGAAEAALVPRMPSSVVIV